MAEPTLITAGSLVYQLMIVPGNVRKPRAKQLMVATESPMQSQPARRACSGCPAPMNRPTRTAAAAEKPSGNMNVKADIITQM